LKLETAEARAYFDWAATALPDSAKEPVPFGNPSSLYREGQAARTALENARERCAAILGVDKKTVYFTSGGTEANAIVLFSALLRPGHGRVVCSSVEHPSVRENCRVLERLGKPAGLIPVEQDGRVSKATLEKTLDKYPDTRIAAIMAVNNETGAVMDMQSLVRVMRARGGAPIHVHCDLVQAIGKVPVSLTEWDVDSAAISAHKLGGPRGIGLLYLRKKLETLYSGGAQESGIRPGTENTAGALALAACLERHAQSAAVPAEYEKAAARLQRLMQGLAAIPACSFIPRDRAVSDTRFSPYVVQVAFKGMPGEVMVRVLDDKGFAISTGSACSSSKVERPVLAAMGVDEETRREGIRISQGWSTTTEEIDRLLAAILSL
jgi:cysteine desulfurase